MRELNDLSSVADLGTWFYIPFSSKAMLGEAQNFLKPFGGTGSLSAQGELAEIHHLFPISPCQNPALTLHGSPGTIGLCPCRLTKANNPKVLGVLTIFFTFSDDSLLSTACSNAFVFLTKCAFFPQPDF